MSKNFAHELHFYIKPKSKKNYRLHARQHDSTFSSLECQAYKFLSFVVFVHPLLFALMFLEF